MARCFLTGVEFPLQQAFVLNRREARDLIYALKDRVAGLQRVIEQLSPLDSYEASSPGPVRKRFVPKKHRLVCKAVADALASGFPEIELFLSWLEYRARVRRMALHGVQDEPVPGTGTAMLAAMTAPADEPRDEVHEALPTS